MHRFKAMIGIIGINPYVPVPEKILESVFRSAGKEKGAIPVCGTVNKIPYKQTLVKYKGSWRLYINTKMLKDSPKKIGEVITVTIDHDPEDRTIPMHPLLVKALKKTQGAKKVFDHLPPSRQKEIIRYIAALKTEESIQRNVAKAIDFLLGKGRFAGRDKA